MKTIKNIFKGALIATGMLTAQNAVAQALPVTPTAQLAPLTQTAKTQTPYEFAYNKLSDEAKADLQNSKEGANSLIVTGSDGVAITVPEVVKVFSGEDKPENWVWLIDRLDSQGNLFRRTMYWDQTKNALVDSKTNEELKLEKYDYKISTDTLLKKLNKDKSQELKLTIDKNVITKYNLDSVLFNKDNYMGTDRAKPEVDFKKYDGCYVVFNEKLAVGGKKLYFAQVKPFAYVGKNIVRDDEATRNLDLTNVPNLEERLSGIEQNSEASAFPEEFVYLNTGATSELSTVTTTKKDKKGNSLPSKVEKYPASTAYVECNGQIIPFSLLYADGSAKLAMGIDKGIDRSAANATAGLNLGNLKIGAGYGLENDSVRNLDIGDGFRVDTKSELSGPVAKAILTSDKTKVDVSGKWYTGNASQTLSNVSLPGFTRMMIDDAATKNIYNVDVTQAVTDYLEAKANANYTETNSMGSSTSDGKLGLEARVIPHENFNLFGGAKIGKQLKGYPGTSKDYTEMYGGAGFRF